LVIFDDQLGPPLSPGTPPLWPLSVSGRKRRVEGRRQDRDRGPPQLGSGSAGLNPSKRKERKKNQYTVHTHTHSLRGTRGIIFYRIFKYKYNSGPLFFRIRIQLCTNVRVEGVGREKIHEKKSSSPTRRVAYRRLSRQLLCGQLSKTARESNMAAALLLGGGQISKVAGP